MKVLTQRRTVGLLIIAILLLIPFAAMQFTKEVNWGWQDFLIAAVLLFSTFLACEWVVTRMKNKRYRILLVSLILLMLLLIWAELAVGIF
jgi:peptidoglycan/LPS O-acetylase OafA/YrhL